MITTSRARAGWTIRDGEVFSGNASGRVGP
jgi:hypothetical protein